MNKYSYIQHIKNNHDSRGNLAEWVIKDHNNNKILSSHETKEKAMEHLKQMHIHKESNLDFININSINKLIERYYV